MEGEDKKSNEIKFQKKEQKVDWHKWQSLDWVSRENDGNKSNQA